MRRLAAPAIVERLAWCLNRLELPELLFFPKSRGQPLKEIHAPQILRKNGGAEIDCYTRVQGNTGTQVEFSQSWEGVPDGLFLIGPPVPTQGMELFGSLMGGLLVQMVGKMIGLPAEEMARLEVQETGAPVTVLATPEAVSWVNVTAFADTVKSWTDRYEGEKRHPTLLLGEGKYRIRVRNNFSRPKDIEAFVLLAFKLRDTIQTNLK